MQGFPLLLAWLFWVSCHHCMQKLLFDWVTLRYQNFAIGRCLPSKLPFQALPCRWDMLSNILPEYFYASSVYLSVWLPIASIMILSLLWKLGASGTNVDDCCWFCWTTCVSELVSLVYTNRMDTKINRKRPTEANTLCRFSMDIDRKNKKEKEVWLFYQLPKNFSACLLPGNKQGGET